MKRKRKIFQTREEYEAWKAAGEARQRELQAHIERIKAELASKRKSA
jgi:hypothetical protein